MRKKVQPKRKLDTGILIGVIAIIINIITVCVYMYQAKIMQSQQHASAWPYLEWLLIFNEEQGLQLELKNNGIGPAIIKETSVKLKGVEISMDSLFVELIGTDYFPHLTSVVQNRVLAPQNSIKPFQIVHTEWASKVYNELQRAKFEFSVCYESVYGDQWTTYGTKVTKSDCR